MSQAQTLLLGVVAGGTILLGLPLGRLRSAQPGLRVFLNATAAGILIFLLWDVLTHAWEPIDAGLVAVHDGTGGLSPVIGYALLLLGGLAAGLLALAWYERRIAGARQDPTAYGPGAMAASELGARRGVHSWSVDRRTALLIAVGIGLHNFGEGLAIGGSAAQGEIALATLLVIGFALHNATEGFGIVAPLSAASDRPEWSFLLLMGLIGGGPTVLGTVVGRQFTSEALSVLFLALAAGSILYVVVTLLGVASRSAQRLTLHVGLLSGLAAGLVTDMVVTAAGA